MLSNLRIPSLVVLAHSRHELAIVHGGVARGLIRNCCW